VRSLLLLRLHFFVAQRVDQANDAIATSSSILWFRLLLLKLVVELTRADKCTLARISSV
jgi:hypothetical protein